MSAGEQSSGRVRLAVETAFPELSVALAIGERIVLPETDLSARRAAALHPAIDELLRRTALTPRDLDEILIDCGPGSYTGLRVGLAAVRAIRELLGTRIRTLFSTDQLAWLGRQRVASEAEFLVCLDARRGQWYAGRYRHVGGRLERLSAPSCLHPEALRAAADGVSLVLTPHDGVPLDLPTEKLRSPAATGLFELTHLAEEVDSPAPVYLMPPI